MELKTVIVDVEPENELLAREAMSRGVRAEGVELVFAEAGTVADPDSCFRFARCAPGSDYTLTAPVAFDLPPLYISTDLELAAEEAGFWVAETDA